MDVLFFLFAVVCFALAANVIWPIYRHPKYSVVSFIAGWPVGELALHTIFVQLVIVLAVVWCGALSGGLDVLSLTLIVIGWLLLAYHYLSAFKSLGRFAQNLEEGASLELDWRRLVRPFYHLRDHGLCVDRNIVYREVDGFRLKLDLRRRDTNLENAPVLMQIHGGGWTKGYGSKNEQGLPLMQSLAKQGWICVSIDYRLSPKATFPEHFIDCKYALRWVKDHISEYGGDPNFIVVTGGSAGGHLSSLLALSDKESRFHEAMGGAETVDYSVQGCVPFYGIYDLLDERKLQKSLGIEIIMRKSIIKETKSENTELYALMSPIKHISESAPPFLIVHGDKDSLTSFDEGRYFANALRQCSNNEVHFAAIDGAQHAFEIFPSLRCDLVVAGVSAQVNKWHAEYVHRNA